MPPSDPSSTTPFTRLRRIGGLLIDTLLNRVQLLGIELREEQVRALEIVVLGALAFFFAQLGLLLLTLALAFLFREHAIWAVALGGVLYGAIATACCILIRRRIHNRPPFFAGTVEELKKDREWLNSLR
jgi:uncharacterized membrane protein YqjE